ncbi:MAG: sugar phosphate isomerase/epimerase family protein [Thermodesulfobacteriota bacterium]|nr:sugar phosphate isomerase/epimerase family protein [Thermodesulfobacteriota bacterium]
MLEHILKNIQISIPFKLLKDKYMPLVLENRVNPEIGIDGGVIDTYSRTDFSEIVSVLRREGLSITLHGPFYDLVPGGMDKSMVKATRERLRQVFDLIPLFEPSFIVCHTGYDKNRYNKIRNEWVETSVETWSPLVEDLKGTQTILLFENVYERTPDMLNRLLCRLDSEKVGFCFDAGHMTAFSETAVEDWLKAMGPFLKEVHLHDNDGTWDDHLAIGAGEIDFDILFKYLEDNHLRPIITLEAHVKGWIWQSVEALSKSDCFRRIVQTS